RGGEPGSPTSSAWAPSHYAGVAAPPKRWSPRIRIPTPPGPRPGAGACVGEPLGFLMLGVLSRAPCENPDQTPQVVPVRAQPALRTIRRLRLLILLTFEREHKERSRWSWGGA